jgi:hypothetical protein
MKRWMLVPMGLIALATFLPAGTVTGVGPFLECVTYNPDANEVTAYWGYINTNAATVTIGISSSNFFDPPPGNRGQPLVFSPGTHHRVVSTTWSLNSFTSLSWNLDGIKETASNDPNLYCANPGVPCWDANANGVCDASEDVNGDGKCDALDCLGRTGAAGLQGPQGQKGATGPAGPPGSPGLSPAIAIVTVPSTSATATASCSTNQVLLNGGGTCAVPNTNSISGRLASSAPSGSNGWTITCTAGNATAVALCAPRSQ